MTPKVITLSVRTILWDQSVSIVPVCLHHYASSNGLTCRVDKIVRLLGQGTFGKVVEARHIESRRKVAIKVIRAVQKYRDASKIEIRVLETLKRNDPTNS